MQLLTKFREKALIACGVACVAICYVCIVWQLRDAECTARASQKLTAARESDPEDRMAIAKLLADSQKSVNDVGEIERNCSMYQEFRHLNFLHNAIRRKLCINVQAFERDEDGYPLCRLQNPFNEDLLDIVRRGSDTVGLVDLQYSQIPMFVYKGKDFVSMNIKKYRSWEWKLVNRTLRFALKLPDVTFLDMGSNIGVYSLQAAKLGLPVVALDANIRNLLRLRLSLNASSLDAALVWNFITADQNLKYLSFLADCNVGGAGRDKADLPDTVPVMPLRSERICDLIRTKNVVMKMDIQGGETDFLLTSGRLFTDFNVAAVQMEWYPPMIRDSEGSAMVEFLLSRRYAVWRLPDFVALNPRRFKQWGKIDVIWVREDFITKL